jgi:hypothetical protein
VEEALAGLLPLPPQAVRATQAAAMAKLRIKRDSLMFL